jgi:hypothetical protein
MLLKTYRYPVIFIAFKIDDAETAMHCLEFNDQSLCKVDLAYSLLF